MQYIEYSKIEELLKVLPTLRALLANLQIELKQIHDQGTEGLLGQEQEVLYSQSLGNKALSDMPRIASNPGDKETRLIANHKEYAERMFSETEAELKKEITILSEVVEKFDVAIKNLTPNQQYIKKWFYLEGSSRRSWSQIADDLNITENEAKNERRLARKTMSLTLRVTEESYRFAMKKAKGE